jgi:hypothetical protein
MIATLNTSPTPPSLMVLKGYTIDGMNRKQCSGCRKTNTMKAVKVLATFPDEQHVLCQCSSPRCSWHDAMLHLVYKSPTPFQQTVDVKPKPIPLPSLFNDVKPKPDLFGGQSKQLPSLF